MSLYRGNDGNISADHIVPGLGALETNIDMDLTGHPIRLITYCAKPKVEVKNCEFYM